MTPRERALQVFSEQGIWDTEENTGVLIYLLWADHAVEIIADRAANRCQPSDGRHVEGVVTAIHAVSGALSAAVPAREEDRDELPNRSMLL